MLILTSYLESKIFKLNKIIPIFLSKLSEGFADILSIKLFEYYLSIVATFQKVAVKQRLKKWRIVKWLNYSSLLP